MTYQPTKTGNLIVEKFPVKAATSIAIGEIVYVDAGVIAAANTAVIGPYFVALEASTSCVPTEIMCGVAGEFPVQAHLDGGAVEKGDYVEIAASGEVGLATTPLVNEVVGIAMEAAVTTATTLKVLLGHFP